MGMTIDMSDFMQGLKKLADTSAPKELEKGIRLAGAALIKDAKYQQPYAPKDSEGALWRSARVDEVEVTNEAIEIKVGFNIAYAARWHEISQENMSNKDKLGRVLSGHWPIHWSRPGSGAKYLESKMANSENRKKYLEVIGVYLKSLLGG
jgi:hypothetical protein